MKKISIRQFQNTILNWYKESGRHDLPWRPPSLKPRPNGTLDPYKILVSEIMLQQTQVDRVIEKYKAFLRAFPTARKLATASIHNLLTIWKGLGYNRRALNLRKVAQQIVTDYRGHFPTDVTGIERLPGIGHYTARAIATFAFNQPHAFIETNIRRVFIHFFLSGRVSVRDTELMPLIEKALYKKNPRAWYSALMDYGALAMKDIPNPNTKSRHYARQSRFEGSRRYARAKILDYIMSQKKASMRILTIFCENDPYLKSYQPHLQELLDSLVHDGFIKKDGRFWHISDT